MSKEKEKQRLQSVVDYIKFSRKLKNQSEFAALTNVNPSALSAALKGNEQYLTGRMLERVAYALPEINSKWLLSGEGEMLAPGASVISQSGDHSRHTANIGPATCQSLDKALDEIAAQRKLTEKSQEQIDRLLGIVENMQNK